MSDNKGDKTGPGNPPSEYRWKKGGPSPNPQGRPRKRDVKQMLSSLDDYAEMVVRLGDKKVQSTEGPIEFRESYLRKLAEMAYDKDTPAKVRADILKSLVAIDRDAQAVLDKEKQKQFNAALDYKERWSDHFRVAEATGRKPPKVLPHPDDVLIVGSRVTIVGPKTPDEQAVLECRLIERSNLNDAYHMIFDDEQAPERLRGLRYFRRRLAKINKEVPHRLYEPLPSLPPANV